jgi:hypothetical protein
VNLSEQDFKDSKMGKMINDQHCHRSKTAIHPAPSPLKSGIEAKHYPLGSCSLEVVRANCYSPQLSALTLCPHLKLKPAKDENMNNNLGIKSNDA